MFGITKTIFRCKRSAHEKMSTIKLPVTTKQNGDPWCDYKSLRCSEYPRPLLKKWMYGIPKTDFDEKLVLVLTPIEEH